MTKKQQKLMKKLTPGLIKYSIKHNKKLAKGKEELAAEYRDFIDGYVEAMENALGADIKIVLEDDNRIDKIIVFFGEGLAVIGIKKKPEQKEEKEDEAKENSEETEENSAPDKDQAYAPKEEN